MDAKHSPYVRGFIDFEANTVSYVIWDKQTNDCAIIDSVLDLDYSSGNIKYLNADKLITFINANKLKLSWFIETYVHADHLSAAPYI